MIGQSRQTVGVAERRAMENLKWLNLQEERITSALEENLRRKQFLEDELNVIQNLKKMVQGNTTEADCPEN